MDATLLERVAARLWAEDPSSTAYWPGRTWAVATDTEQAAYRRLSQAALDEIAKTHPLEEGASAAYLESVAAEISPEFRDAHDALAANYCTKGCIGCLVDGREHNCGFEPRVPVNWRKER